jgi:hypothetical protein
MYLRKKHLSRRTVLRGAGVALALPFLDAMVPAATALADTAAKGKPRAGFFYLPHGTIMNNQPYGAEMDAWTPQGTGADMKFNRIMEPLQDLREYVTTFDGIENLAGNHSVHIWNPSTWLSCTKPDASATGPSMATTVDQMIAQHIGQDTPLPSLELASETTVQSAACAGASGGCFYSSTLSWSAPNRPLPMEYNPRKVFTALFGEGDTPAERKAIAQQTRSLLDLISERTASLKTELGKSDKTRLDDYLDTVREIERRVEKSGSRDLSGLELPPTPVGELPSFDNQVKLMFDLIALAYQADLTRVVSFIMVSEGTNRTYNHIGVPDSFHPVSHHANDKVKMEKLIKIQRYHLERFAEFAKKLSEMPDGENSVLENSLFLYGSNMSNSDRHNNFPLPTMFVGHGMGKVKGSQHLVLPERTPLANVHLTMLNRLGLPQQSFADATGVISEV